MRHVCQFSCGAASAVAAKLILAEDPDAVILNAFLAKELDDNRRFAADCERWFGKTITTLRDEKFGANPIEVFKRRRFIKGLHGAPCSIELKRKLLDGWKQPGDVMVLGFTAEEADRFDDWVDRSPTRPARAPLIEHGLTKEDCKAMVVRAGILLPLSYRMGYDNANCKCCPKGGEAYFRAQREDFPDDFNELADVEQELGEGAYLFRRRSGPLKGQRFSLRELGDGPVRRNGALPSCSFFCELAEEVYAA